MPLDDFCVILGQDFMRKAKAAVIPYLGGLMINDVAMPCFVCVCQDKEGPVTLMLLQLQDGLHRGELTYVASMH